jgi:Aldo/keto reductase family
MDAGDRKLEVNPIWGEFGMSAPIRAATVLTSHAEMANRRARHDIGCVGGEPAGAHDVGERQQARDQFVRWNIRRGHQRAVRERDTQQRRLRTADELFVLAGCLIRCVADEPAGFEIMDAALESGINFIDTADVYGGPQSPDLEKGYGVSEEIIERWPAQGGRRERYRPDSSNKGGKFGRRSGVKFASRLTLG